MSKTTIALEAAVARVLENMPKDAPQTNRQRANVDRAFADILKLIAPRIRHFIRQYGLVAHWDDAEQCCAIAVHRAIQAYDPEKAKFTTFVNWQIRGELQSLRFRVMTDQRPSAKKVEATTVSLNALAASADGEGMTGETLIEDEDALERTEAAASEYLADNAVGSLIDAYVDHLRQVGIEQLSRRPRPKREEAALRRAHGTKLRNATHGIDPAEIDKLEAKLARDREIVERRVFQTATLDDLSLDTGVTKERVRQITKRAAKAIAEIASSDPRFMVMAEYAAAGVPRRPRPTAKPATALLPDAGQPHNRLASIRAVAASELAAPARPAATDGKPAEATPLHVSAPSSAAVH